MGADQPISAEVTTITPLIEAMKEGDEQAFARLVRKYEPHVRGVIRDRLRWSPKAFEDESDVFASVVFAMWRGIQKARFEKLVNRDQLWALLYLVAVNKSIDVIRRNHSNKQLLIGEAFDEERAILPAVTTAEQAVAFHDYFLGLLADLPDDESRLVVRRCLEGYTNQEIAAEIGCAERTVERKLKGIRQRWQKVAHEHEAP